MNRFYYLRAYFSQIKITLITTALIHDISIFLHFPSAIFMWLPQQFNLYTVFIVIIGLDGMYFNFNVFRLQV